MSYIEKTYRITNHNTKQTDPDVRSTALNCLAFVGLMIAPAFTAVPGVPIYSDLTSTPAILMDANTVSSRTTIASWRIVFSVVSFTINVPWPAAITLVSVLLILFCFIYYVVISPDNTHSLVPIFIKEPMAYCAASFVFPPDDLTVTPNDDVTVV